MLKKLIVLMLILVSFIMGYLMNTSMISDHGTEDALIRDEDEGPLVKVIHQGQYFRHTIGTVIEKSERSTSIDTLYQVEISIPEQEDLWQLAVTAVEYQILQKGMEVGLEYVLDKETEAIDLFQWQRDDFGRLVIKFKHPLVVLDPGHGGSDTGQGGNDLWVEKDLNLAMTLQMKDHLEEAGIQVVMTRDNDSYRSLYDRVAIANYVGADMLISNHNNRWNEVSSGVEVLYSQYSDRDFANTLARAISSEEHQVFRVYNRQHDTIPGVDYYSLHHNTRIPSYIIEYGFADNENDRIYVYEHWEEMVDKASAAIIEALY